MNIRRASIDIMLQYYTCRLQGHASAQSVQALVINNVHNTNVISLKCVATAMHTNPSETIIFLFLHSLCAAVPDVSVSLHVPLCLHR